LAANGNAERPQGPSPPAAVWAEVYTLAGFRTGTNTLALPQPDPDVLRLARRGDERAFAIIVRQYHGPVFNYVTRVLSGDRALAEDICQEVFMRVYQALPGFDGRCQFTTWLFQVAKHRVVDELRARERRGRAAPQLHVAGAPPDADDGMDAVWIAIGGLSVDLKMALLLRDLVGLSYAEIAESLDTTLATVKWRIYKARETVVAELLREGYDFGHRPAVRPPVAIG
jgi:RNA polymerase sigma-70 factor (ECF subfamily)